MVKKKLNGKIIIKPCEGSPDCLFIDGYKKPLEVIIKEIAKSGSITGISYKIKSESDMIEQLPSAENVNENYLNRILEELKSYPGRRCSMEINFSMISDKY